MSSNVRGKSHAGRPRRAPLAGSAVIWPSGVEIRYGISAPTRWRWEKSGRLPPRDVDLGGKTGWKPTTLEAAEIPALAPPLYAPRAGLGIQTHDAVPDDISDEMLARLGARGPANTPK